MLRCGGRAALCEGPVPLWVLGLGSRNGLGLGLRAYSHRVGVTFRSGARVENSAGSRSGFGT